MKATIGDLPSGEGWAYELKWDGMRIQADGGGPDQAMTLRSISGRDVTSTFAELTELGSALGTPATLDGEVVVFDGERPSFASLQHRMHVEQPSQPLVDAYPAVYIVFDLLRLDGRSLVDLPFATRRRLLSDFLDDGPSWRVSPLVEGDGEALLAFADERGLEGVVAKRLRSPYRAGARTSEWLKVKVRRRQEFVVIGWLPGQGALTGSIGSLLLGVHDDEQLRFCGAVGSGLADDDRRRLRDLLEERATCPVADVPELDRVPSWVEPTVVVEVEYGSWPQDGLLRHPVYVGRRVDHDPEDVVRELPP